MTIADPPHHSFVAYGHERSFVIRASQSKQVGARYWQTDRPEFSEGSSLAHSFIHSNDDVLKRLDFEASLWEN